ncbi:MAG TPA: DUF1810 domain-containing protein [Stenomitos sp.]
MSLGQSKIEALDPFKLHRFVQAQEPIYQTVLAELRQGQKRTHWMWFIFPQIAGLGYSSMAKYYAIQNRAEAQGYFSHHILGPRLIECSETVLKISGRSALDIFGQPDQQKLRSSMTLFAALTPTDSVFTQVLDQYFEGERDTNTLKRLDLIAQDKL